MKLYSPGLKGTVPLDLCPSECAPRVLDASAFNMDDLMLGLPLDLDDEIHEFANYPELPHDWDLNVNSDLLSDAQSPEDYEQTIVPEVCKPRSHPCRVRCVTSHMLLMSTLTASNRSFVQQFLV